MVSTGGISIHALLAESDGTESARDRPKEKFLSTLSLRRATLHCKTPITFRHYFYPRSPCGERPGDYVQYNYNNKFLSTLSLRRATIHQGQRTEFYAHFYPRSPCGERRSHRAGCRPAQYFYPRSPCGERLVSICYFVKAFLFLSTLSLRRATGGRHPHLFNVRHFYPRSPCGERLPPGSTPGRTAKFLSTLSLRRATVTFAFVRLIVPISIHALLAESDHS